MRRLAFGCRAGERSRCATSLVTVGPDDAASLGAPPSDEQVNDVSSDAAPTGCKVTAAPVAVASRERLPVLTLE